MFIARFVLVSVFFALPLAVFAQDVQPEAKEKIRRQTILMERILSDAGNLRLAENRAFVTAKIAHQICPTDEKRARQLFQSAVTDLIQAQTVAGTEKNHTRYFSNLTYGQNPRWEILFAIADCDAEFALEAMLKTRPPKLVQALLTDSQTPNRGYGGSESQNEQRLIALIAEQNPQRAVKLLRESIKREISHETFNLLKKVHQKDSETANQIAEEIGGKLLSTKLNETNQDSSLIQYFLAEFGQTKAADSQTIKVSDTILKNLADKIVKFSLRPNATSFYSNGSALQVIERFFPASVEQMKKRQEKFQNQHQNQEYKEFSKLTQSGASADEMLSQIEKFPAYRNEIYRQAAEKTAQSGSVAQARGILTENLTGDELDQYLLQFDYNQFNRVLSEGKFDEAAAILDQISDENYQFNGYVQLANAVYQKDPKENQERAAAFLEQARLIYSDAPENLQAINNLVSLASTYARIESAQAFRLLESLIAPINEYAAAAAVVAKYQNGGNLRHGEYLISGGGNMAGVYNLSNVLQILKDADFERAVRLTDGFNRLDMKISLQLQLLDSNRSISNAGGIQVLRISGRRFDSSFIIH